MNICSLCNGIANYCIHCPSCSGPLEDQGRLYDYYDEYSAYMDIDLSKMEDGQKNSSSKPVCMHMFICTECNQQIVQTIYFQGSQ